MIIMLNNFFKKHPITVNQLIITVAVFWMIFANFSFIKSLLANYPLNLDNLGFLTAIIIGFAGVLILVMAIFFHRYTTKPLLIILLLGTSSAAYFMDSFGVLIDDDMIHNMLSTNVNEASDLITVTLFLYIFFLGILPSILVWKANIVYKPFSREFLSRLKLFLCTFLIMLVAYFSFSAGMSSFFREHKQVRYHFNPANYTFGIGRYVHHSLRDANIIAKEIGQDAIISEGSEAIGYRELIIMVVGETARADRFSLNGYEKETNPLLERENVVSFTNVTSCGTSTALSVPCMFSYGGEAQYKPSKAKSQENALDVLHHAGVNLLWRDNNSSSKDVAKRIGEENYLSPDVNTMCDGECRDVGMLVGLQNYVNAHLKGDIVIVLHQMGNHGPAYYKRYPKEFEKFKPACKTQELSDCSLDEISNAYDNAILYTDYFLAQTIDFLKQNDDEFETAMFYVSDHGESLGEYGLYLHGMPNFMAPKEQRHVPMIMWFGKNFDEVDINDLKARKDKAYSHDNVFHTLLNLVEIDAEIYNENLSLLH